MWLVVAGLMVAVILVASKKSAEDSPSDGALPPNSLLPGTGASAVQSPATTGANPLGSQAGKLIASMTTRLPGTAPSPPRTFTVPPPAGTDSSATDKMLRTQTKTPTVETFRGTPGAGTTFRKI